METNTLLLSALLMMLLVIVILIVYIIKSFHRKDPNEDAVVMLQNQLFELSKELKGQNQMIHSQMNRSQELVSESMQKQLDVSAKVIKDVTRNVKDVTERLTQLDETNKRIAGFAEQMKSLENILKNPKQRGVLGEYFLENILSQEIPPEHYRMQYKFSDGNIVDAVVFIRDKIVPIDAKFSLENYNRLMDEKEPVLRTKLEKEFSSDLKKRIDETAKYVKPAENTTEFAFMFIPADGIFYNILTYRVGSEGIQTKDLIEYAFEKRVILVSPMTFFAYLQTVMQSLKALAIEKKAVEIQKQVNNLSRHLNAYGSYMKKLGGHLGTAVSSYNAAGKEFEKIDKDIFKISGDQMLKNAEDTPEKLSPPEKGFN